MKRFSATLVAAALVLGAAPGIPANAVGFKTCEALNAQYPTGIAKTAKAAGNAAKKYSKPRVDAKVYSQNIKLDKDKDLVICPVTANSADPYSKKWGTFEKRVFTGTGDEVIELSPELLTGIVNYSHSGSSNFIVTSYDKNMGMIDLLANEIGSAAGATAFGLSYFTPQKAKFIEISADGTWSLEFAPVSTAPEFLGSGSGTGVYKAKVTGGKKTFTHSGESNFVIWQWCTNGVTDLLANEIGQYSGSKLVQAGTCLLVIDADGPWSMK